MNTKQQGDLGVAIAIAYYTSIGAAVSVPLGDSTRYDLIIDRRNLTPLERVQVKSTRYKNRVSYEVQLATAGGNQSWNKQVKKLSAEECEEVFILVVPTQECYVFPSSVLDGKSSLCLSKDKDQYRVWTYTQAVNEGAL